MLATIAPPPPRLTITEAHTSNASWTLMPYTYQNPPSHVLLYKKLSPKFPLCGDIQDQANYAEVEDP
jgi:hypothetical protein